MLHMINDTEQLGLGGGATHVYLQVRQLSESLFTFRVGTFVRPVARVDSEEARTTQQVINQRSR